MASLQSLSLVCGVCELELELELEIELELELELELGSFKAQSTIK